ncbi:MAG: peptidoglycan binding domain-containing protein [Clostridiaceae bacterium]|nr:peptidoglycan binding domain-containing protein [Clostridiaceae bacterium]
MKSIDTKKFFPRRFVDNVKIVTAIAVLIYLMTSLYFMNHFFFNTVINGVDVSLIAHDETADIIIKYIKNYSLQLIERDGETEEILGQDIGLEYNKKNSIYKIYKAQSSIKWPISLFIDQKYYVKNLFTYNKEFLNERISSLNCLNKVIIEPQNVRFEYSYGCYEAIEEVAGNKIHNGRLYEAIKKCVSKGQTKLDLDKDLCYINPKYTLSSEKTSQTQNLLNKHVSTRITYILRNGYEILDHNTINKWLSVDEDLKAVIDEKAVRNYVKSLSKKYDTAGAVRNFKTSVNKVVEVEGGYYGWKMDVDAETKELIENIKRGEVLEKEPVYAQKALFRGEDDIGDTYVEISLTKQYLWFYKAGKLIAQGPIVSGNPNRGNATDLGVYMLNYKETETTIRGPGYEAEVNYWMPFNVNTGIHDAGWRYSFGGNIYKKNGSHGCINVPLYLAKKIYENIDEGTPIICYEDE